MLLRSQPLEGTFVGSSIAKGIDEADALSNTNALVTFSSSGVSSFSPDTLRVIQKNISELPVYPTSLLVGEQTKMRDFTNISKHTLTEAGLEFYLHMLFMTVIIHSHRK